ncbi:MAG: hypothetical protein ACK4GN_07925 [Runella sp.]
MKDSLPSNALFKVGIIGENVPADEGVVSVNRLDISQWEAMRHRYDDTALSAAAKPFFAEYFFKNEDIKQVVYFDPTIQVFGDLGFINQQLQDNDVIITPRIVRPLGQTPYGDEKLYLNTGMYDSGFWAMKKTENSSKLLHWWQKRMTDRGYLDLCKGMNYDQLWFNYFPMMFEKVLIYKNIGCNVALHNLHERILTYQQGKWWVNTLEPLLFFNFRECIHPTPAVSEIVRVAGAGKLCSQYMEKLKINSTIIPPIFSLYRWANPPISAWRKQLKRFLESFIKKIDEFPLYH